MFTKVFEASLKSWTKRITKSSGSTESHETNVGYDMALSICGTFDDTSFYGSQEGKGRCMIAALMCTNQYVNDIRDLHSNVAADSEKCNENPYENLVLERTRAKKVLPTLLEKDGCESSEIRYPPGGDAKIIVLKEDSDEADCIITDKFV